MYSEGLLSDGETQRTKTDIKGKCTIPLTLSVNKKLKLYFKIHIGNYFENVHIIYP